MVAADARTAIVFALSPGHDHDAPHGRALLEELGPMPEGLPMLMDRAYEGNETRQLVLDLGMIPVVPPKSTRLHPWDYDHAIYKKRNEIERLFLDWSPFLRQIVKTHFSSNGELSHGNVTQAVHAGV
jgi:transposase